MKAIIKINNIPFDEQLFSRSILKYATNEDFDIDELTDEQMEQFEESLTRNNEFDPFYEDLSFALAEYVSEHYGEEYGIAFRGLPDNADGIWFQGLDVDYDTLDEIREKCRELANDTEWLNENISEYTIEYDF